MPQGKKVEHSFPNSLSQERSLIIKHYQLVKLKSANVQETREQKHSRKPKKISKNI